MSCAQHTACNPAGCCARVMGQEQRCRSSALAAQSALSIPHRSLVPKRRPAQQTRRRGRRATECKCCVLPVAVILACTRGPEWQQEATMKPRRQFFKVQGARFRLHVRAAGSAASVSFEPDRAMERTYQSCDLLTAGRARPTSPSVWLSALLANGATHRCSVAPLQCRGDCPGLRSCQQTARRPSRRPHSDLTQVIYSSKCPVSSSAGL